MSSELTSAEGSEPQRQDGAHQSTPAEVIALSSSREAVVRVDARGLEPPGPMVAVLEALPRLVPGQSLLAHTDRRPMHLYAQLEARGYRAASEELSDGSVLTRIEPA